MSTPQVWFVTGASSGFGRSMVEYVLNKGDIAVATLRNPEALNDLKTKYPSARLLVLKLDVTQPQEIADAFEKTKEVFGRLDVVFNNAGYPLLGEVEGTPEDAARSLFDVTFWGADRVGREAIKFFREVNKPGVGGRLLNTSSSVGFSAFPGVGYYSASKYALEGISQALAAELDPEWNIKITLIEPGVFTTNAMTTSLVTTPLHPAYDNPKLASVVIRNSLDKIPLIGADPDKAIIRLYELARLPDPPLRFLIGKDSVASCREQIKKIIADVDQYESWSEGLEFENKA